MLHYAVVVVTVLGTGIREAILVRYIFNPVEETFLGTSKVNVITIGPSVW